MLFQYKFNFTCNPLSLFSYAFRRAAPPCNQLHLTGLIFKGVHDNGTFGNWKDTEPGQGLFTLTKMITYGDFYIGSKMSKSDYLSVSGQFVA